MQPYNAIHYASLKWVKTLFICVVTTLIIGLGYSVNLLF